jgi:hypothetical protein
MDPEVESDLRRRAVWLLIMIAVVAVLLVIVISAVAKTSGGGNNNAGPRPLDSAASTSTSQPTTSHHPRRHSSTTPRAHTQSSSSSAPRTGTTSCPTAQTCVLDGDIGNASQAINAFRAQHGQPAVPVSVSAPAQTCAVNDGNGCTGSWAETYLADPDGQQAVQKIEQFAHLLDPSIKSIGIGWAYDPQAKQYNFAVVRIG